MPYYAVVKPGIIYGNLITMSAGFFLALSGSIISPPLLLLLFWLLLGMALVLASGCVVNNIVDRDIDALMKRTQQRALVTGALSVSKGVLYAIVLALFGLTVLYLKVNLVADSFACIGLFIYLVIYTCYAKRKTHCGIELGALAGAMPPIVGYCAVTHALDLGAWSVFLILFFWQIPHSYAIGLYRIQDYQAAKIPVLPVRCGVPLTIRRIRYYIMAYCAVTTLPLLLGLVSPICGALIIASSLIWLLIAFRKANHQDYLQWARQVFLASILIIMLFSGLIISFRLF